MSYERGIKIKENSTSITAPTPYTTGVQVVVGTAPIHLAEDPFSTTQKPILASTFAEAQKKLGYSEEFDKYTICESMFASFQLASVGPVVFINVLDPEKHKESVTDENITLKNGAKTIDDEGVLLSTVTVKGSSGGQTYERNKDYTVSFDNSDKPVITAITIAAAASLKVSYDKIDASKVTKSDIIGGYDSGTGHTTGTELIQKVFPMLSVVPGLLLAPGWSHYAEIGAVLAAKSTKINGCFNAGNVLDIDSNAVQKYEDVPAWKSENGYSNERSLPAWPKIKVGSKILWYSSVLAAEIKSLDSKNDDVPADSPSNKKISISAAVLPDGSEIYLDITQANYLSGQGIITALNWGGWRIWGPNTAAYPTNTDPKDRYINLRRLMDWWGNTFILTFFDQVDDLTSYRLIQGVVDSENIRGNGLQAAGHIAGASIEFREDQNSQTDILNGNITFITKIGGFTPAELITNILEFDPTFMVSSIYGGEEE